MESLRIREGECRDQITHHAFRNIRLQTAPACAMYSTTRLIVVVRVTMVQRDIRLTIHDVLCDLLEGRLPSIRHV